MEPVVTLCALTAFIWAVAIWASWESEPPESEPAPEEEKREHIPEETRKAA
jgi:hypothetical protein